MTDPHRWRSLAILVAGYASFIVGNYGINVLLEPIKRAFNLTDGMAGAIPGVSVTAAYVLFSFPAGLAVDRMQRRGLLAASLTLSGLGTIASSFTGSMGSLLAARFAIGAAQTPCSPAASSMISDLFPPAQRSTAFGLYFLASPIGLVLGFLPTALIAQAYGWRAALFVSGLPCLAMVLLLLVFVKEPVRGGAETAARAGVARRDAPGLWTTLHSIGRRPALQSLIAALTLTTVSSGAFFSWLPALYIRAYGMRLAWVGPAMALGIGICGGLGAFCGGVMADRLGRRDVRHKTRLPACASAAALLAAAAMVTAPNVYVSVACMGAWAFSFNLQIPASYDLCQGLSPVRSRGTTVALLSVLMMLGSAAVGPQVTGLLSQALTPLYGAQSLRRALLFAAAINVPVILLFARAGRTVVLDLAHAERADMVPGEAPSTPGR